MKQYAIIDENNMCVGCAQSPSEIKADNYIELKDGEEVVEGYIWNGETWEKGTLPIQEQPLTEKEQIAIDTALNVEYMACLMEASLT